MCFLTVLCHKGRSNADTMILFNGKTCTFFRLQMFNTIRIPLCPYLFVHKNDKNKDMNNKKTQLLCAVAMVFVGAGLLIAGLCIDPAGEIHPSVLVACGEMLTFAGAVFGIDYRYRK